MGSYEDVELTGLLPVNMVLGQGEIDGRPAVVQGDDFTVRGGAADAAIWQKMVNAEPMAHDLRLPLVRLVDGPGGGGSVKSLESMGYTYVPYVPGMELAVANLSVVPVVAVALGPLAGLGAARVVASHFSVMTRGTAQLFVAGPPVVAAAMGEAPDKEPSAARGRRPARGRSTTRRPTRTTPPPSSRRSCPTCRPASGSSRSLCSVLVRKVAGVAGAAHQDACRHATRYAWPSGHWGSLPIAGGLEAAYRRELEAGEDPVALRAEIEGRLNAVRSPFRTAERFGVEEVIDPRDTRPRLCARARRAHAVVAHEAGDGPKGSRLRP